MSRESNEEQKIRLQKARQRGYLAGARGDPIWYNPYTERMAHEWREGWRKGQPKER